MILNLAGGESVEQLRRTKESAMPAPPPPKAVARKQKELAKISALLL